MSDVILFGGTTEGRLLAEFLSEHDIAACVCVATEYASTLLHLKPCVRVLTGRLDESAIEELIRRENAALVVDATHPYADIVTKNVKEACDADGCTFLRVKRAPVNREGLTYFDSLEDCVKWLAQTKGVIFSSIGTKGARELSELPDYQKRVILRILPYAKGITDMSELGYPMKHLYCMQGPFSQQFNEAQFRETDARILLTKESGVTGGFAEKVDAALALDMQVAVIRRPEDFDGVSLEEAERAIMDQSAARR